MADSFVFVFIDSLCGKLASYAFEEASRVCGVYEDVQGIKDTLSIIESLLLDAEEKKNQQHVLREWLRQIQDICSDAEVVLEEVQFHVQRKQDVEASRSKRKKVRRYASSSNPIVFRFKMANRIKEIRGRLDKVAAEGKSFGLVRIDYEPGLASQRRELTHSHIDASSVIGREDDKEAIIQLLKPSNPHGDKSLCVIPIVGIGGLGKTTLAKLVFNDQRIDQLFQLKIWVCVSDNFDLRQVVIKVINSASATSTADSASTSTVAYQENINHFNIEQLQICLRRKISGKRYLLVLDDIWNDDLGKWNDLKELIEDGTPGCKIIATTRCKTIASMMGNVPSYVLKGLSTENCLSLFVKWVFKEGEEENHPKLVEIGKEIVKKCVGVPLAVRTFRSYLFSNFDFHKWESVRDHGLLNLGQKNGDILPTLQLSYDQMPSYLKQCVVSFSLYPRGFTFHSDEIINLWVALGLVQSQNGSEKIESIVRKYLDELNSQSFLEDFKDHGFGYKFKVHDLIYDLAQYTALAAKYFIKVNSDTQNIPVAMHLSILENVSLDHVSFPKSEKVRTILYPVEGVGFQNETHLGAWVLKCKYLWYLDLSNSSFETLPTSVPKLKHLRVLYIRNNHIIKSLPRSIDKLQNLQVLSLVGCMELETLPEGFEKLTRLRRLFITTKQYALSHNEFACLKHLQVLGLYHCDNMKVLFSGAQSQLTSLEALYVQSCKSLESLPLHIFPKLQTLLIEECPSLNLSLNNKGPLRMKHLHLKSFPQLLTLPRWIEDNANTLETLKIQNFPNLKKLPECLTTMTHLKSLFIGSCPQLFNLPSDLYRLTALEELHIYRCPELCRKCLPLYGEYWPKIHRIKRVSISKH